MLRARRVEGLRDAPQLPSHLHLSLLAQAGIWKHSGSGFPKYEVSRTSDTL